MEPFPLERTPPEPDAPSPPSPDGSGDGSGERGGGGASESCTAPAPVPTDEKPLGTTREAAVATPSTSAAEAARDRFSAMLALLDDDSRAVVQAVRKELEQAPKSVEPTLRRAARDSRARVRARARQILAERARRSAMRRLLGYARQGDIELERALFLLGRLERPDLDTRPYRKALDAMGAEVGRRAAREPDAFARSMVLTQYLGNELGFIGSEVDFSHPDNIHLHRTIERKQGMPLTLTAIYLFVARRAGIEAVPLALPGRVLLRVEAGEDMHLIVDPFAGGRVRTRADCEQYLAQHGLVPQPVWFHGATDRMLFERHTLNLMSSCEIRGLRREARDLHELASVIGRSALDED